VHGVPRNTLDQPGYRRSVRSRNAERATRGFCGPLSLCQASDWARIPLYSNFNLGVIATTFSLMSGNVVAIARAHQAIGDCAQRGTAWGVRRLIASHAALGFGIDVATRVWVATMVMQITPMISITAT
jgi:hypothetical protein